MHTETGLSAVISESVREAVKTMHEVGPSGVSTQQLDKYAAAPDAKSLVEPTYTDDYDTNPDLYSDGSRIFKGAAEIEKLIVSKGGKLSGEGSSRKTFFLTSKKILKLAKSEKGIGQNQAEIDIAAKFPSITTKIYHAHSKGFYLISELVRPLSTQIPKAEKQFEEQTGFSLRVFYKLLSTYDGWNEDDGTDAPKVTPNNFYEVLRKSHVFRGKIGELKRMQDSPFVKSVLAAVDHGLMVGDLTSPEHWGVTAEGRLVLLDYGYTADVADKYYE